MSGLTFERLRIPIALLLLVIAGIVFLPRATDGEPSTDVGTSEPSVVVGQPGGEVVGSGPSPPAEAGATATPGPTATPTTTPTNGPTPAPVAEDGFSAEVVACLSISGSTCNGQLGTLSADEGSFTALVRFADANAGDTMNAVLSGPSGTIPGGPYTLQGGGDGYYYSTFSAGGLPPGDYTLTATRNGDVVAVTTFTRAG